MRTLSEFRRWESERRYYCALLHQDLLGDWVLDRVWGGKFNKLGGQDTRYVRSVKDGMAALDKLDRERRARRYVPLSAVLRKDDTARPMVEKGRRKK
jgi:predicted DNA-binding WGR domain protein